MQSDVWISGKKTQNLSHCWQFNGLSIQILLIYEINRRGDPLKNFPTMWQKNVVAKTAVIHDYHILRCAKATSVAVSLYFEKSANSKIIFENAYLDKVLWLLNVLIDSFHDND